MALQQAVTLIATSNQQQQHIAFSIMVFATNAYPPAIMDALRVYSDYLNTCNRFQIEIE